MNQIDLLLRPYWEEKDLGKAIPPSQHALSVALPRWQDVVAYEEKEPKCMKALKSIYPRFGLNPLIQKVANKAITRLKDNDFTAWPYSNLLCAQKAEDFCKKNSINSETLIIDILGLKCLAVDKFATPFAKSFWQHTGLGASSREAAIALNLEVNPSSLNAKLARDVIKERLSNLYCCEKSSIFLYPSGMAALANALEIINKSIPNRPTVQIGFPYVDVLKLPQVIFNGGLLLQEKNLESLEKKIDNYNPSALIIEVPSNPMLQCVDLINIAKIAHKKGIPIIADDTIGSAGNVNLLPHADLIFSSLTKSFAGRGDVMAGSLVISPDSVWGKEFAEILISTTTPPLSDADSIELEKASRDINERLPKLNEASLALKRRLEKHPLIKEVFYPERCKYFQELMKPKAGFGCLLSFELVEGLEKSKRVYDALQVCKGPSFGTNFTLVSPYVLLAHYKELNWAEKCGVPPHLLRVSVGLEEENELWARFTKALVA